MKITRKDLEKSIVELTVEESVENVAKQRKKAIAYLTENAEVKGFRKGAKIPEEIIVRQFWEDHINRMTIDYSIDKMYRESLKKEKIMPVAQGEIKEIVSESPLIIKIHVEVFPTVEIDAKYKKVSLTKEKVSVSAEEVKNALAEIETKFTKFEETTDKKVKLKMWDKATITTMGYENQKELENTNMVEYPLVLGSNILVPWFEEQLVWAKIGDELEFPIDFAADYHNADFANKKTTFKVTIHKIEKAVKPEFTEEFIEQLRGKKLDLAGFKKLIKEEIKDTKEANARMKEEGALIDELLKVTKMDLWDKLIAANTDRVFDEIKQNMAQDNIKMVDYLESLKMDEATYKETNVRPTALKRLQGELILHKLQELENAEISDAEMKKEIEKIMSNYHAEEVLKRLAELYVPGNKYYEELKQRMVYRKIIDSFFKVKTTAKKA